MDEIEIVDAADAIANGGGAFRIPEKDYHADPCPTASLSSGIVKKLVHETPAHAWYAHPRLNPDWRPDAGSRRMALGSACHSILLGRGSLLGVIDADNYRTKAAQAGRDEAVEMGLVPILKKEHERAVTIVKAAHQQLIDHGFGHIAEGSGSAETVVARETLDGWKRIMIDWWSDDRTTLVDYKTIDGSASPDAFARRAAQMDYDIQAAFYMRVVGETFPSLAGRLKFLFVVQEIDPPYCLSVCEIAESDRTVAERKVLAAEKVWFECLDSGKWPGYPTGVQRVTMPVWHTNAWLEKEADDEQDV
jgi:hypothetical protein